MTSPITVAYCFDKGYAPYAAVSTFSLASNAKSALQIFWIVPQEDQASIVPIKSVVEQKTGLSIKLITVPPDHFDNWKTLGHISRGTYLRLLIPTLIHESRVIYVDADTLVMSDLGPLFSMDMGDHLIAGVPDPGASMSRIPRRVDDPYLNAGVLLMDLDALRNDGMLEKAKGLYQEHEHQLELLDQCLLNKYAEGRKLVVDSGWNRMMFSHAITESHFNEILKEDNLAILHFVTVFKPWQRWCTPAIFDFWWSHANQLGIQGLRPETLTTSTAGQALSMVNFLDTNERFKEASSIKSKMIDERLARMSDSAATA
ncbi:General stress protein A [Caballeronia pedi]|uniref:General stress protein A n=1 Tax=Caballeronia pedi TaxID=1777141 RepID=A0A157Z517_9BURK|nr:glycosyltransferase family 8 protein [Caballeronia pedi]SAK40625.1 General stress protein A [Caballeronia pedi]